MAASDARSSDLGVWRQPPGSGVCRSHLLLSALALLCVLLLPVPLAAQDDGEADRDLFLDSVDVDIVNLQVSVTDKDGKPIRGLSREDFEVEEDGDPVTLTNFYAIEASQRIVDAGGSSTVGVGETLRPIEADESLSLALVIDNANISPANRKRALDQLRGELIRIVRPGDRVMVGVLNPLPNVEQAFTDDLSAIDAALDRLGRATAGNSALEVAKRQIYAELAQGETAFGAPSQEELGVTGGGEPRAQRSDYANLVHGRIEAYANQSHARMRRTYAGIEALIGSMGGLPGRKAVLYVSDGLSTNTAIDVYAAFIDTYGQLAFNLGVRSASSAARPYDLADELQNLTRAAAATRVTFYTLDSYGARSANAGPEFKSPGAVGAGADLSSQQTLIQLAAATGGATMLNAANVAALLDTVSQDHSDYYSLGYISDNSRDSKFHRIKIKVPGLPGAQVRHTEGYRAQTVVEEMADRTLSALMLDVADNPLEIRIELGDEQVEKSNRYVLPVLVKVPISKLVLVPQEKAHRGMITIFVAVRDDDGGLSQPQHIEVPVNIPNEQLLAAMSREVGYGLNLLVRGGPGKLAVGVRDEIAAVESTVNLNISIGKS